ncbi:unnamed protein product [Trypanosoma congolense IL3000]|uniref:WGS project CAEQ00000000 data, annotated contig 1874 n=1 Tax=Trypanosoma congolense (strain IL3000) TaxID=1068625 RepID=F9W9M0_TRYCI|nr:unnamed protein product [Trypanosoma congolense IL3000]
MIIHSPCTQHIAGIGNPSAVILPSLVCCFSSVLRSTVHTSTPHSSQPPFNRIGRSSSHTATQTALTAYFHFTESYSTPSSNEHTHTSTQVSPNDTHSKHHPLIPKARLQAAHQRHVRPHKPAGIICNPGSKSYALMLEIMKLTSNAYLNIPTRLPHAEVRNLNAGNNCCMLSVSIRCLECPDAHGAGQWW